MSAICDDEKRKAQEKLEAILMEGIQSGAPTEMRREDWAEIRREAVKQIGGSAIGGVSTKGERRRSLTCAPRV